MSKTFKDDQTKQENAAEWNQAMRAELDRAMAEANGGHIPWLRGAGKQADGSHESAMSCCACGERWPCTVSTARESYSPLVVAQHTAVNS